MPADSWRSSRSADALARRSRQTHPASDSSSVLAVISDTGSLKGPRQPIFFRHDIHAGQFKIQCQYCHYSVAVSPEPGIPSMQTCMGCHLVVGGQRQLGQDRDQEGPRRRGARRSRSSGCGCTTWRATRTSPTCGTSRRSGPNACTTCHGDVTRMPQVFKVNNVEQHGFLHHLPRRAEGLAGLLGVSLLAQA